MNYSQAIIEMHEQQKTALKLKDILDKENKVHNEIDQFFSEISARCRTNIIYSNPIVFNMVFEGKKVFNGIDIVSSKSDFTDYFKNESIIYYSENDDLTVGYESLDVDSKSDTYILEFQFQPKNESMRVDEFDIIYEKYLSSMNIRFCIKRNGNIVKDIINYDEYRKNIIEHDEIYIYKISAI